MKNKKEKTEDILDKIEGQAVRAVRADDLNRVLKQIEKSLILIGKTNQAVLESQLQLAKSIGEKFENIHQNFAGLAADLKFCREIFESMGAIGRGPEKPNTNKH